MANYALWTTIKYLKAMTEKEKEEFEEFLQWKAEKNERLRTKEQESSIEKNCNIESQEKHPEPNKFDSEEDNHVDAQEVVNESNSDNSFLKVGLVVGAMMVIVIIFAIILPNGSSQHDMTSQTPEEIAYANQQDSMAKVEAAEYAKNQHRTDSIRHAERVELIKKTIRIKRAYLSSPNSAGGVDVYFAYKNISDKTIKYLVWTGYPINAVGDPVECEIRNYIEASGKDTGPIKPGRSSDGYWDCMWYNFTAKKFVLTQVQIEYMDGSMLTINKDELKYIR